MKYYFTLQYKILNRYLKEWITYPILFIVLFPFFFVFLFNLAITLPYGNFFFILILVQFLFFLGKKNRNNFLKINFKKKTYRLIRVCENFMISSPFILIEIFNANYFYIFPIMAALILMSFLTLSINYSFVLPTPFKHSFEFIYMFRKSFLLLVGSIILTVIGVNVNNFNLTIFSLFVPFSIITLTTKKTEPIYFVWLYKKTTKEFTKEKIKYIILNTTLILVPYYVIAIYGFPEKYFYISSSFIAGVFMVVSSCIVKYANFTSFIILETVIGFIIVLSLGSLFNPLFLFVLVVIVVASLKKYKNFIKSYLKC